jgi:hypothetical protein
MGTTATTKYEIAVVDITKIYNGWKKKLKLKQSKAKKYETSIKE